MVQLASLIACQALGEYRVMLGAALTVGVTPVEVKEIVYQAVPYVGMAQGLRLHPRHQRRPHRARRRSCRSRASRRRRPRPARRRAWPSQKQIVGADVVEQMYASAPDDEMHIQRLLSANCFGDHYTRTGIDVPTRELLTFAMLVSLGGCEPQAKGHVAANLNVGNDRARAAERRHAAAAVHRLPPHAERAASHRRSDLFVEVGRSVVWVRGQAL